MFNIKDLIKEVVLGDKKGVNFVIDCVEEISEILKRIKASQSNLFFTLSPKTAPYFFLGEIVEIIISILIVMFFSCELKPFTGKFISNMQVPELFKVYVEPFFMVTNTTIIKKILKEIREILVEGMANLQYRR